MEKQWLEKLKISGLKVNIVATARGAGFPRILSRSQPVSYGPDQSVMPKARSVNLDVYQSKVGKPARSATPVADEGMGPCQFGELRSLS